MDKHRPMVVHAMLRDRLLDRRQRLIDSGQGPKKARWSDWQKRIRGIL